MPMLPPSPPFVAETSKETRPISDRSSGARQSQQARRGPGAGMGIPRHRRDRLQTKGLWSGQDQAERQGVVDVRPEVGVQQDPHALSAGSTTNSVAPASTVSPSETPTSLTTPSTVLAPRPWFIPG